MNNFNGKTWRILTIILTAVLAMVGAVYGYGKLNARVDAMEREVQKISPNEKMMAGMQKDIEYIKSSIERIEKNLNQGD